MPDVEDVYGGDGNDKLTGDAASNTLDGGAGDDTVEGASGHDALFGGEGDDTIRARDGVADQVDCGPAATRRSSTPSTRSSAARRRSPCR
jgi:hypothetical protein